MVLTAGAITRPQRPPEPPRAATLQRRDHALMFMDYPGFATLDEAVLPLFYDQVMQRAAAVLDRYAAVIRETAAPASASDPKNARSVSLGGGAGRSRRVASVTIPSVPCDPTMRRVRS